MILLFSQVLDVVIYAAKAGAERVAPVIRKGASVLQCVAVCCNVLKCVEVFCKEVLRESHQ